MCKKSIVKFEWKETLWIVVLIVVSFLLLFLNRKLPFFPSDEGDNFLGAKMVANGLDVYKEFPSQHMPVMYYVCAVFYLLGARTIIQFRLFFYTFLCSIWVLMYIRYKKIYGRITMFLYPLLYICVMRFMEFGHCVLSEQMWAQGMVVLLLEYFIYLKERKVSIKSACWISFAIFVSFGTAFMAAASIGTIFLGVLYQEIVLQKKQQVSLRRGLTSIWNRNRKLIVIILIPFSVLLMWYLISGNLYNAYYGSVVVNREFYSQYLTSIQSILGTLLSAFVNLKNWIWSSEQTEVYFQIIILGAFLVVLIVKKAYAATITIFLFTVFNAIRGIGNFHSHPFHAVIMMMAALLIGSFVKTYFKVKIQNSAVVDRIVLSSCFLITLLVAFFPLYRPYYESKADFVIEENESIDEITEGQDIISKLTYENEKIYECTLNTWLYFETDTLPVTCSAACPWIYDAHKKKIFEDLEKEKPRIVLYNEECAVWGYRFGDFASELCEYFEENYTALEGYSQIYIINEYYDEAMKIIEE